MINKSNLKEVLMSIGYIEEKGIFTKVYPEFDGSLSVDFNNESIIYPEERGLKVHERTTCNFSDNENFVVLECITRLMDKGYRPEHIEIEKKWQLGHDSKSGRADILVTDDTGKTLFIIECKTYGKEYEKAKEATLEDGAQLFSYWQQEKHCKWLILYASTFEEDKVIYETCAINCSDDNNLVELAKKDTLILLYKNATTVPDLYNVWKETYEKNLLDDILFREDSVAYQVGAKPLRKKDLKDFVEGNKIVNKFEEILRHNNVSDKENAFNRLVALFICKLVDEIQKSDQDVVDFQYKVGTDTYESLQDRLQRLHKEGMEKFMREKIFYIPEDYASKLIQDFTGQKRSELIKELNGTLRNLKFYTNNDFAFKDVHNEELFLQNSKILVEVVKLFEKYKIIGSNNLQMLGDLFEQLLNKGFKQNEGQFFTPVPITHFIWDSLPLENIIRHDGKINVPKIIDYACGACHFLTEGFKAINDNLMSISSGNDDYSLWVRDNLYGIEKDYRLARVSKISLFMHGAGDGNIIFGDGLENYTQKGIIPGDFDILVANPPYSVSSFKPHLNLKNNTFKVLGKISNNGSEIETLFVERISQLLKPKAVAAVILPSSILNKESDSFIAARESILENFKIRAIVSLASNTFGATGTNTVVLFLEKFDEPPKKTSMVQDSVAFILTGESLESWEDKDLLKEYLKTIGVDKEEYSNFVTKQFSYNEYESKYFKNYVSEFMKLNSVKTKKNQRVFRKLSKEEQDEILTQMFYSFVFKIESVKLKYFALTYKDRTLIINAPNDNRGQEEFLGYKWSNRKGQEGIQIIKWGGKLYNNEDRQDEETLAALIRKAFNNVEVSVEGLEDYYYYLNTKDMLDFRSVDFNKVIKTREVKLLKTSPDLTTYYLSDSKTFELSIGDRVLNSELEEGGKIPVYSANVFEEFGRINKKNITDFSKPSILWGIDGDWMVNIIPANKEFYPTDHCGVLRLKTDKILPKYLMYVLQVEGESERFSRSYRASIQKVKQLVVQVPKIEKQNEVVSEIEYYDNLIETEDTAIKRYEEDIKSKFVEMFASNNNHFIIGENPNIKIQKGQNLTRKETINGEIPVVAGGKLPSCYHNQSNREGNIISVSSSGANAGYINYWKDPIFATDCNTVKSMNEKKLNTIFLYYAMLAQQDELYKLQRGNAQPHIYESDIKQVQIPVASIELQEEFASYVKNIDKLKFEARKRMDKAKKEKEKLIETHFM